MSQDLRFLEIEHKFVVDSGFDQRPILKDLHRRNPEKIVKAVVQDTYFIVDLLPQVIFRHRLDNQLQQLTMKSLGADSEIRTEVNLDLQLGQGNQLEAVQAFLAPLTVRWHGTLQKIIEAFYFPAVEIVFYEAVYGERQVRCFEVEARQARSIEAAQRSLAYWEQILGFNAEQRSPASLLDLLVVPTLSLELQERFRSRFK